MFLVVGRESQAACAAERSPRQRLRADRERFGPLPQPLRRVGAESLTRDVVPRRAAAESKAAVTSAGALGDSTRIVHAHAQAAARERERARQPVIPAPMTATSTSPCGPGRPGGVGSSSQNGVSTKAMLCEPAVDPVSFRHQARDVELCERSDHLGDCSPVLRTSSSAGGGQRARGSACRRSIDQRLAALDSERLEDVGRRGHRRRAEPEQRVRTAESADVISPGTAKHLAPLVERQVGGDQRAAALARLDDDRRRRRGPRRSGCAPGSATAQARRPARTPRRSAPLARSGGASSACAPDSRGRCRSRARRPCGRPPRARRDAPRRRSHARAR